MTTWVSPAVVRSYALVKWDSLNYATSPPAPFANESDFDTFLIDHLIPSAQAHINAHCKRDFDVDYPTGIPEAVRDVCGRATANMIQYLVMNKMGPLIRVGDYRVSMAVQDVLTPELQALLIPWRKRTSKVISTPYKTKELDDTWEYPEKDPFLL